MELSSFPSSFFLPSSVGRKWKSLIHTHFHNPNNKLSQPPNSITRNTNLPSRHHHHHHHHRSTVRCLATTANSRAIDEFELESKKHDLLRAIQDTQRGLLTTPDQRSSIEEALVCVEGYDAGTAIDLGKLDGTWRLQYTSAPDVVVLFESTQRFPFFQVGQIFQKFECRDQTDGGVVRNIVQWSIPTLLEEQEGATLLVSAKFSVVSKRNIYLQFEEVSVQNIKISEELQSLIAPALLPRTYLSLQILQFIQTFKAAVPVRSPGRQSVGGLYYLSFLDNNMLLGRAVGGGGVFVFTKAQPFLS
ncbi:Plastid lipid-associated protein/fibrillin conserved domain [Macleaya cordata]|uniref:Plastid lipid-associated protein/fibrillin conserved domain n=1 Tax=Macleaya cordata TaxID=56857 RepID=A0A200PLI3_MACCD|nr:Plastid lipid-associated protein/fibrillin conserved domain [Macleaya cordata]